MEIQSNCMRENRLKNVSVIFSMCSCINNIGFGQ